MLFGSNRFSQPDDEVEIPQFSGESARKAQELLFGEKTQNQKLALSIVAFCGLMLFAYIAGFLVAFQDGGVKAMTEPIWIIYSKALFTLRGWTVMFILTGIIGAVYSILRKQNDDLKQVKGSDSRGVDFAEKGTYGTAEWMSRKEANETYEVGNIKDVRGVILAQYGEGGEEAICLAEDTKSNRNILVLGSPGTGKSWCYVRNAIYQAIVRNESIVVTDPKGELYKDTAKKLEAEGYTVKVFNLVNTERSDSWNCMREIYDPYTGDVSELRVTEFADTVMKNTCDGPDDHFWGSGENNLFKAIIMFCAWNREKTIKGLLEAEGKTMLREIKDNFTDEEYARIEGVISASVNITMNERESAFKLIAEIFDSAEFAEKRLQEIKLMAPPCDISSVYHKLVTTDISALEEEFSKVPVSHPASIAWSIFRNGSENTRPGFVQGLAQRLQLFQSRSVRRIVMNDDIVLADLGKEKIALFCVISDKTTAMRALTSLFFTFLFKDVADAADHYGPENRIYVNVIGDEFANLGSIPQFDVTISTVRSRKINISIILQSVKQLESRYDTAAQTIISCCDTILFLGCNDDETAEFISGLSGVASIRVLSVKDNRTTSLGSRGIMQGYSIGEGDGKRNLLNPDEVRRLPRSDVLLYHNGHNILQAQRCGYDNHPFGKEKCEKVSIAEYPLAREKYAVCEEIDSFLQADLQEQKKRNQDYISNQAINNSVNNSQKSSKEGILKDDFEFADLM